MAQLLNLFVMHVQFHEWSQLDYVAKWLQAVENWKHPGKLKLRLDNAGLEELRQSGNEELKWQHLASSMLALCSSVRIPKLS